MFQSLSSIINKQIMLIMLHCDIKMYLPVDVPPPTDAVNLVNLLYAVPRRFCKCVHYLY